MTPLNDGTVRIGFTEGHGMAAELSRFPPSGIEYSFLSPLPSRFRIIGSPIKGFLRRFEAGDHDLIEAVLSPIITKSRWVYSLGSFIEATAFNLFGRLPIPLPARVAYITGLFKKPNFRKLIFWSHAGRATLLTYGGVDDESLAGKTTVIYPAVREVPVDLVRFNDGRINIFFSGDFFRKGGVNVVDAFERAQKLHPSIKLRLCCDERIDFRTPNSSLKAEYLAKISRNQSIENMGRLPREKLFREVLPETDIFAMPTYVEVFGMAILEAMAFGIPVISTNHFAIPEMVEHGVSGLLVDTSRFDCERLFRGYVVKDIPDDFRTHVTDTVFTFMCKLIESIELRRAIGLGGLKTAREKFSFETRHKAILEVYREALR